MANCGARAFGAIGSADLSKRNASCELVAMRNLEEMTVTRDDTNESISAVHLIDRRLRVLLVDDDRALREQMLIATDSARFRMHVAVGIPAAASLIARNAFDLLVCGHVATLVGLRDSAAGYDLNILLLATKPVLVGPNGLVHIRSRAGGFALCQILLEFARPLGGDVSPG